MLIWLENTPVFTVGVNAIVTGFIDKIICCQLPVNDFELQKLVNRQIHRHFNTCRKKSKNECRFNYPKPPMRATEIVYPLENYTTRTKTVTLHVFSVFTSHVIKTKIVTIQ